MGKGFIRGVIAGAFVSFLSVCVVSILSNAQRAFGPVASASPDMVATTPADQVNANGTTVAPGGLASASPEPDTIAAVENSDIVPGAVPNAGDTSGVTGLAPVTSADAVTAPAQDAPVAPNAAVSTPERPSTEPQLSISTDPAQPPVPELETASTALRTTDEPNQPAAPQVLPEDSSSVVVPETIASAPDSAATDTKPEESGDVAAQANAQTALIEDAQAAAIAAAAAAALSASETAPQTADLPDSDTEDTAANAAAQAAADAARAAEAERVAEQGRLDREARFAELARVAEAARLAAEAEAAASATRDAQMAAALQAAQAVPGIAPVAPAATASQPTNVALPVVTPPETADAAPAAPANPASPADPTDPTEADVPLRPAIGQPVNTLTDIANGVRTNRLPTALDPTPDQTTALPSVVLEADSGDASPLVRYATPFENPDDKPLMSIVLMDDGVDLSNGPIGIEALGSFPYPISFAVDVTLPDAAERMATYRADGFEVLATIDLPEGATAIDAEVMVAAALSTLPETVAIMEGVGTGVQTTRAAAEQVSAILSATGHGFVTQNRGLNTPQKLAARAGVPSAVIFRDFDAEGQTPTVIRRFLDQAAFRARQEGGVIMMGRLREDTISALLVWGLQDRATEVALAPVSALLATQ